MCVRVFMFIDFEAHHEIDWHMSFYVCNVHTTFVSLNFIVFVL